MTALDPHHRKLRSQGGDDSWGNQIRLPREIHDLIHAHPEVAYQHGMLVREHEDPAAIEPDLAGFMQSVGMEGEPAKETKPRKRLDGEARRKRRTISVKVPNDTENGGELWDETVEQVKARLVEEGLYSGDDNIPVYEALMAALRDWLDRAGLVA